MNQEILFYFGFDFGTTLGYAQGLFLSLHLWTRSIYVMPGIEPKPTACKKST